MSDVKKYTQTLFDIPIFTWDRWDIWDLTLQFYNVEFQFESMKQYNGYDCELEMNGRLTIWDEYEMAWQGFICEIPEFMEELNKKYKG